MTQTKARLTGKRASTTENLSKVSDGQDNMARGRHWTENESKEQLNMADDALAKKKQLGRACEGQAKRRGDKTNTGEKTTARKEGNSSAVSRYG